jgi:hypothetical protein
VVVAVVVVVFFCRCCCSFIDLLALSDVLPCRFPNFVSVRYYSVKHAGFIEYKDEHSATIALNAMRVGWLGCSCVCERA